jgi:hypothetical protein
MRSVTGNFMIVSPLVALRAIPPCAIPAVSSYVPI